MLAHQHLPERLQVKTVPHRSQVTSRARRCSFMSDIFGQPDAEGLLHHDDARSHWNALIKIGDFVIDETEAAA